MGVGRIRNVFAVWSLCTLYNRYSLTAPNTLIIKAPILVHVGLYLKLANLACFSGILNLKPVAQAILAQGPVVRCCSLQGWGCLWRFKRARCCTSSRVRFGTTWKSSAGARGPGCRIGADRDFVEVTGLVGLGRAMSNKQSGMVVTLSDGLAGSVPDLAACTAIADHEDRIAAAPNQTTWSDDGCTTSLRG